MSERNTAQDPSDAGLPSWDGTTPSNRPAEGATHVESVQRVAPAWNAGAGATDFLGLEQDVAAGSEAPGASAPGETRTWLFDVENEGPAAATDAFEATGPAAVAPGIDPTLDPQADPGPEAVLAAEPAPATSEPRVRRRTQWLAAAGLLACLAGAAGWQFWRSRQAPTSGPASNPVATRAPTPRPATAKPTPPVPRSAPPVEAPSAPSEPAPAVAVTPTTDAPEPDLLRGATSTPPELAESEPAPEAPAPAPAASTPFLSFGSRPAEPLPPVVLPKGVRRPTSAELANLWTETAIPIEAIAGERELRTPQVGAVRVLLKNGEHVQGRLHSVGLGRLSVDVDLGRMAIEYRDVGELVQIVESDLTRKPSGGLPDETAGLPLVSARVPGGFVTGWLVNQDQGKLTLITEYARKVTIDDRGFEAVSQGKARVVGSLAQRK